RGGRMLFLGLGTGLGSAMITEGVLEPLELAHLPYKRGKTYELCVGIAALEKHGAKKWTKRVFEIVADLKRALLPDQVVLGGGNAKKLSKVPPGCILGHNENARKGGLRLWQPKYASALR